MDLHYHSLLASEDQRYSILQPLKSSLKPGNVGMLGMIRSRTSVTTQAVVT